MRQIITLLLIVFICSLTEAAAQQTFTVASGQRVRIHTVDSEKFTGFVKLVRNDTLFLSTKNSPQGLEFPFRSVSRLETHRRASRAQGAWKWAKRGFAVGAITGAVTCGVDVEKCRESQDMSKSEIILSSAFFVGGGVAFLGAVGGAIFPGRHWERVSISEHVNLMPGGNRGLQLSASWKF